MRAAVLLVTCILMPLLVTAGPLQHAFELAMINDPQYKAARAELSSTRQSAPLARSALRPNVSMVLSDALVKGSLANEASGTTTTRDLDYRAPVRSLNLRMPLYNREASQRVLMADQQVAYGEALFVVRTAEMLEKVAVAYFQLSIARHQRAAATFQHKAALAQRDQAQRVYELGEGTKTNAIEANASVQLSSALLAETNHQVIQAELAFQQTTGTAVDHAITLEYVPRSSPQTASSASLEEWLAKAASQSPSIAARRIAVAIAETAIERNSSGHYPRLDLIAGISSSRNESVSTINQTIEQQSVGLQLNLPLYSGGYVSASVIQSLADLDKAQADLEAEQQNVARTITRLYFAMSTAGDKAAAYQKILEAQRISLEGQRKSVQADLASQVDVVLGESKVAQAGADAAKAFSEHILAGIQLTAKSGGGIAEAFRFIDSVAKNNP